MRSRTILAAVWLLVAGVAIGAVALSDPPAPAARGLGQAEPLQAALDDAARELGVPGATAAVVDDGEVVWSGVTGVRSLVGPAVEPSTQFATASAGKTVVAAMVLRLAEEGRLSVRDRLADYVPGMPGGRRIRILNLLEHSSGLPDYLYSREINQLFNQDPLREWDREEVLDAVRGKRLRFRPGSRVSYSNTNYIALGGVIEAATGSTIEAQFDRLIAEPLGLADSSWLYDPALFERGAHPYLERRGRPPVDGWGRGFVSTDYVGEVWTDGGLATTGTDLAVFANALVAGDLLTPRARRVLLRFREQGYGRGIFADGAGGRRIIGHDGLYGGFSAQHWTDPESGVTIAVLANLETRGGRADSSWAIWKRLARVVLAR